MYITGMHEFTISPRVLNILGSRVSTASRETNFTTTLPGYI